ARDTTYAYLCSLVPELKKITPKLMELDWDSAYSLKTTCGLDSPCPHGYVHSVTTTDSGYIDLGFFTHPEEAWSRYFMVVNRDGIARMDTAIITITFHFPGYTKLEVTNVADTVPPTSITDTTGYFTLVDTFAPGEGKLYKVIPSDPFDPKLQLKGEWRESRVGDGPLQKSKEDPDWGWAWLEWTWTEDKPDTVDSLLIYESILAYHWAPFDTPRWYPPVPTTDECDRKMIDSCVTFCALGFHRDGDHLAPVADTSDTGTMSGWVHLCCPDTTGGCPDLYSFVCVDTTDTSYVFMENNTILPLTEGPSAQARLDLLPLDVLNPESGRYFLNIRENGGDTTHLYGGAFWVVDHPEGTEAVISSDSSIYVYSDKVSPVSCVDNNSQDCLDEVEYDDDEVYIGGSSSYIVAAFPANEWKSKGLLITLGSYDGEVENPVIPKNQPCVVSVSNGQGGWTPRGLGTTRMNVSRWLVNVSDADSNVFRVDCMGDSCGINCVELVELDTNDVTITEADLDSAVLWIVVPPNPNPTPFECGGAFSNPQTAVIIPPNGELALSFTEVSLDTTRLRDFVLETTGYYVQEGGRGGPHGLEEVLCFDLDVRTMNIGKNSMMINYSVPVVTDVRIRIVDIVGRVVAEPVKAEVDPGRYQLSWDYKDDEGRKAASGVYFVKMNAGEFAETRKVIITK
ncbi:hypothetical protein JXM67_02190, partial [candidate division WOR-3 bacterium]|nr:hypothetical protein [candidate division WOR-3 bacterium]